MYIVMKKMEKLEGWCIQGAQGLFEWRPFAKLYLLRAVQRTNKEGCRWKKRKQGAV
jgi:hypothetical protein